MTARACALCGLGCGAHPLLQSVAEQEQCFCCMGCMNVFLILTESGVLARGQDVRDTEIYKRSLELGLIAQGEKGGREDSPEPTVGSGEFPVRELLVQVSGMWCTSCAWLIEHTLRKERGIVSAQASFASDTVKVTYCPQMVPPQRILERVEALGYRAQEYSGERESAAAEKRDLIVRLGIAAFLWANIMSLSLVIYAGYFEPIAESVRRYLPYVLMALTTPVVVYCAAPIFRLAWRGLWHGAIRMEALLALGIGSAYFYSCLQALRGGQHLYFDTVSVIVMLVLAGKLIEREAKGKATQWIASLHRLAPNKVRLLAEGSERFVSIQALAPGTQFVVKAGESVPADGTVVEGTSHTDESLLTGESTPVGKHPGDTVAAGSVNLDGILRVRALRSAENSALAQIITQVENALSTRSPVERIVDRVARVFVPCVIGLAALTFAGLTLSGLSGGTALMRAIAVLVIACPCALGLATPLAVTSAMGLASRNGVLISDARVLETLQKLDVLLLDKTGTVTEGRFAVLALHSLDPSATDGSAIALVGSLEQYSEHPLGKALVDYSRERSVALGPAADIHIVKGQGITGNVQGHRVFVGNRRLVDSVAPGSPCGLEAVAQQWEAEGRTAAFYGWDGMLHGLLVFGDQLRKETRTIIEGLQHSGLEVQLVSGDSEATTRAVARAAGIDRYRAEVLPDGKREIVRELQRGGKTVAMVGDGINDAPALAQADLGIAMGSGTDLAMRAAAVVLMDGKLEKLPGVLGLARKTMRIIRQNLFWAFFYNTLGIALAIAGVLNPILAAVAMLLSSASVIGNTTRLMRDEELVHHNSASYPDQVRDTVRAAPMEADAVRLSSSGG